MFAALGGGIYLYRTKLAADAAGLPEQVLGAVRLTPEQSQGMTQAFAEPLDGDRIEVAAYGTAGTATIVVGLVQGGSDHGAEALYFLATRAIDGDADASSMGGMIGDREYRCGGQGTGALCTWVGPDDAGFVAMPRTTPDVLGQRLPEVITEIAG